MSKDTARQWLSDVPLDKQFICHDGKLLKNLQDLASALRIMTPTTFSHHVTIDRNDFSTWINDVVGDKILAGQIKDIADRLHVARKIDERLMHLRVSAWLRERS